MNPSIISSQIQVALRMLRSAIEACPAALWDREPDHNPFWVLAYHALFFAHLYDLRHIQHHAGQLTERLRQAANMGTRWVHDGL